MRDQSFNRNLSFELNELKHFFTFLFHFIQRIIVVYFSYLQEKKNSLEQS